MARLTKREILAFVIIAILLAPLVFWGVLLLLGILFDEPDPQAPGGAASAILLAACSRWQFRPRPHHFLSLLLLAGGGRGGWSRRNASPLI
jgi:hypothetical protein